MGLQPHRGQKEDSANHNGIRQKPSANCLCPQSNSLSMGAKAFFLMITSVLMFAEVAEEKQVRYIAGSLFREIAGILIDGEK